MTTTVRAPLYNLFKLFVAIVLLALFFWLLFGTRPAARQPSLLNDATHTSMPATDTATQPSLSTPVPVSPTSPPLTDTPAPTSTQLPSETPASTATPTPSVTEEVLPTPIVELTAEPEVCAAYARSQLQVGMQATIVRRLNFRSSPGIFNNRILTNDPDTPVEIVGGPACTRYANGGAYLWWQIKLPNGLVGWSAEASAFGAFYFMEPVR